jgi:hypothetical protein
MTDLTLQGTTEEITGHLDLEDSRRDDPVVEAVAAELEDHDTGIWFALLAENGPHAIEAQGWQLQAVLKDRGVNAPLRDVQDAMLQLAHELLPDSAEDPRLEMLRVAKKWVNGRPKEDQARYMAALEEGFPEFWEAPASEFRKFLRRCCEVAMKGAA